MPFTFAEKLLAAKSAQPAVSAGDIVQVAPDRLMSVSATTALVIDYFKELDVERVRDPENLVLILDHETPPQNPTHANLHRRVREFAREQGITHLFDVGEGICHQLMVEKGLVLPGELIFGKDSHTITYGAVGAFSTAIDATEMACLWGTGRTWLRVPHSLKIVLEGTFQQGVCAKDLILNIIGNLSADGAIYLSVEFHGPSVKTLSMAQRMTVANMCIEMGAKNAVFPEDEVTRRFVSSFGQSYHAFYPDPGAAYRNVLEVNLSALKPQIACPHRVDKVKEVSQMEEVTIDQVFLGSCTNGRVEDLAVAAAILKGRKVHDGVRMIVGPASREIFLKAMEAGYIQILVRAGAFIIPPGCGPCFGAHSGILGDGERCLATSNRNFKGRMGSTEAEVYLGSPATAAASAVQGHITDPRRFMHD